MKKINRLLISVLPLSSVALTACSLASCGTTPVAKKHIKDDDTVAKQKTSAKGSFVCDWTLNLTSKLEDGQKLEATITKEESSQGSETINFKNKPTTSEKKISFSTILTPSSANGDTVYWVKFKIKFTCKDNSDNEVWNQTIDSYKHTSKAESKDFFISPASSVDDLELTSTATSISSTDTFIITVNNNRTSSVVTDASLIITAGTESIIIPQQTIQAGSTKIYEDITKDGVAALFTAAGKTFPTGTGITIKFHLARVGAYIVKTDSTLAKIDNTGSQVDVTDAEIDQIQDGTFLVKDTNSNDLILSTQTFSEFLDTHTTTGYYDLYFLKGEFFSGAKNALLGASPIYRLHGILKSDKKTKPASLRVYLTEEEGGLKYYGLYIQGLRFEMNNLKIQGRDGIIDTSKFNDQSQGLWTEAGTKFTDCDFVGAYCTCYSHSDFIRCTFDSTNTKKASGSYYKNNYPMYFYTGATGYFEDCTFTSGGKAVKIYYEPDSTGTFEFEFKNCKFNLSETHTNYIEYPVDIDASEQTSTTLLFKLKFDTNCTVNSYWMDNLDKNHQQITHINDTTDTSGYAAHVKINDESVVPFYWDPDPITE